jgi:hypothetical protein
MRIAYLTTDEVNQELALRLAAGQEAQLEVIWPRDGPPDSCFDAVIYDLDCLPPPLRQQLLADLAGSGAPLPAAVHSYALEGEQIKALLGRGVIVRRRLRATLLHRLSAAVRTKSKDDQLPQVREIDLPERLAPESG